MNRFKRVKPKKHKQRNTLLPFFLLLFLFIGIGYASLTSNLSISGNTSVSTNTWNIYFDNIVVNSDSVTTNTATIDSSKLNINYSAELASPGDYFEFTVDIVNAGTLPGKISLINNTGITPENENYLRVTYSYINTSEIKLGDIINPSETKKIIVRVEIPSDVDTSLLPDADTNIELQFSLRYIQSEEDRLVGDLMTQTEDPSTTFGKEIHRNSFESITIMDYRTPPADAIDSWDASMDQNGAVMAWYKDDNNNGKYELYIGEDGGVVANSNSSYAFSYYKYVKTMNMGYLDTSKATTMGYMMAHTGDSVGSFEMTGLEHWDTSHVKNMRQTFWYTGASASTYRISNINRWDVSEVKTMQSMFSRAGYNASSWNIGDLSRWNTISVNNLFSTFFHTGYNDPNWSIGDLSGWKTGLVTTFRSMFSDAGYNATNFDLGDLDSWDMSSADTIFCMFYEAGYESDTWNIGDISGWQTGTITDMKSVFLKAAYNADEFDVGNLDDWDVRNVEIFNNTFAAAGKEATTWNIGNLSGWQTNSATDMSLMFNSACYSCDTFDIGNLNTWNVSNVTTMNGMFETAGHDASTFNIGDISNWNTSSVTDMTEMFSNAGYNANWNNFGTLKVYANKIDSIFNNVRKANGIINIYNNPSSYTSAFNNTSYSANSITINYTSAVTNIDDIIATKGSSSNVIKGSILT